MDREALEKQIAQEKEELKNAPKIPINAGQLERCHICGQCFSSQELKSYDTHLSALGRLVRRACPRCHPQRSNV